MLTKILRGSVRAAFAFRLCAIHSSAVGRVPNILVVKTDLAFIQQNRCFSAKQPLSVKTVEERIKLVLSLYDKIDPNKLTMDTDFFKDLGLDSLDHVEIVMAIEDEFGFEIPDGDSDRFKTPRDIFRYICDKEDVYE